MKYAHYTCSWGNHFSKHTSWFQEKNSWSVHSFNGDCYLSLSAQIAERPVVQETHGKMLFSTDRSGGNRFQETNGKMMLFSTDRSRGNRFQEINGKMMLFRTDRSGGNRFQETNGKMMLFSTDRRTPGQWHVSDCPVPRPLGRGEQQRLRAHRGRKGT